MIESKTNKIIYLGNGTNRIFNINFDVVNYSTDLKLFLTKVNSNEITEIQNNFSIDKINKTVTYPTVDSGLQPLSSDEQIVILRETNITQELDSKKFFKSSDVEFIADKLTMVAQDLKEITNRSFVGPVTSNENYSETVVDMIVDEVSSKIGSNKIEEHNISPTAHQDIRTAIETLQFVKWINTLPETGESKYIYAIPREETDTDGKQIAALYLWDGSTWRGAGAFSLNIDPNTLATKEELAGYLPKVFDGNQVISPETAGNGNGIVFDSKDDKCKFEIRKTLTGFALYTHKKINDLWQTVAEISSNVENFHKLQFSYNENSNICNVDVAEDGFNVKHFTNDGHVDFKINRQTGATFNGKRLLTEDDIGAAGIPAFPAPAEQTSSKSYTEALGYHHFENKSIIGITFQYEPNNIIKTGVVDGTKTLSFKLSGIWDIILNFTIEGGAVTFANLKAQKEGVEPTQFNFIENGQYITFNTSIWLDGFQVYFDSTKHYIYADFDFKSNDISALANFTDESLSFTLKEPVNPLPAASDYANQLAYIYENGEYSDIKNLIYSDGTSWQFLPGAVLQIPDERMKASSILETPAYCGIELKTGQFAIPSRNKNDKAPYYNVGQMHEFYLDALNPLVRSWNALSFGTQFVQNNNELIQTSNEEAIWLYPQSYTETTFVNKSETIHTQNIKLFLTSQYSYCNFIFCQGTNKIKLTFQEKNAGTKIFYNGTDITAQSELVLNTDAKTVIGKIYSNSYIDCILELYDLPYSSTGGGGGAPILKWYKNNTGSTITIDDTSSSSLVKVYKNGVLLEPIEDYTISGTTLTLTTELISTDKITTEVF